ncbi:hypothetical protein C7N43_17820 [Sphingobacteriales bacterium UPWRP_1]|nr:hypothetical protein B6N25_10855 [Sphingobacteriales bacterium TSM_CSS]PSJ75638.1 hypothetical protein C7N43_17820 [Sphingobacteriales bacterium UPWRP_1]
MNNTEARLHIAGAVALYVCQTALLPLLQCIGCLFCVGKVFFKCAAYILLPLKYANSVQL